MRQGGRCSGFPNPSWSGKEGLEYKTVDDPSPEKQTSEILSVCGAGYRLSRAHSDREASETYSYNHVLTMRA